MCPHEYGHCNDIIYNQDVLMLNLENILDEMKIKDPINNNFYWINSKAFIHLIPLFI